MTPALARSVAALMGSSLAMHVACSSAGPRARPVPVTVVLDQELAPLRAPLGSFDPAIEVRVAELPNRPPAATADPQGPAVVARLAAARAAYVDGEFARCQQELGGDREVGELLAAGRRALAGRVLFWRIACRHGAASTSEARRAAVHFASLGFEAPDDVELGNPEIDLLIARAVQEVARGPRVVLRIRADRRRAQVSVDGRPRLCVAPCALELPPGEHLVRVDADGVAPEVRTVHLAPPGADVSMTTTPASPAVAAEQWTARYAGTPALDSLESMRLLSVAVRARRVALVSLAPGVLRGALLEPGKPLVRAERRLAGRADLAPRGEALVRELFERGGVLPPPQPLWRRPWFWVTVGAAAALGAGLTGYLLYDPPRRTEVVVDAGDPP